MPTKFTENASSRRAFLGGIGVAAGITALASCKALDPAVTAEPLKNVTKVRVAYLPFGTCVAPVTVAARYGYFAKHNLDVELVPFKFHTEEMLNSPATGTTDVAVAMLHNFLLPMQKGLDVKVITPIHGGCVRILGASGAGVRTAADLKGKTIGIAGGAVGELAKMVYSIILQQNDIDPKRDVTFLPVDGEAYGAYFQDGRIQAAGGIDPAITLIQQEVPGLVEVATNMSGPMAGRSCCVVAVGPRLWRDEPAVAKALVAALNDASEFTAREPEKAAEIFAKVSPFPQEAIAQAMGRMNYHAHHPTPDMESDLAFYAANLVKLGYFPADLSPTAFAKAHSMHLMPA